MTLYEPRPIRRRTDPLPPLALGGFAVAAVLLLAVPSAGAATPAYYASAPFKGYTTYLANVTSVSGANLNNSTPCSGTAVFSHLPSFERKTGREAANFRLQASPVKGYYYQSASATVQMDLQSPGFKAATSGTFALRLNLSMYLRIVGSGTVAGNVTYPINAYSIAIWLGIFDRSTGVSQYGPVFQNQSGYGNYLFNVTFHRTYSLPIVVAVSRGDSYYVWTSALIDAATSVYGAGHVGSVSVDFGGAGHLTTVRSLSIA